MSELQDAVTKAWGNIGGEGTAVRYRDQSEAHWIDVLTFAGRPGNGVSTYLTAGVSNFDNGLEADGKPLRVELVGACAADVTTFANMVTSCGFDIANGEFNASPGVIFPDIVAMYEPDATMKHMMLTNPFLWDGDWSSVSGTDHVTAYLQVVPVSQSEFAFASRNGADALEELFDDAQIDVFDLNRPPVV